MTKTLRSIQTRGSGFRFLGGAMLLGGLWSAVVSAEDAEGQELKVEVKNAGGKTGDLYISLFAKPDGFPAETRKAAFTARVDLTAPRHTFTKLPDGKYVVVVFHDRNGNGKIDRNAFGLPQEPIGLSNHPKIGPAAPPSFEKAKIDVTRLNTVTITLQEIGR
jgi:uncharacterized protein (DUF2141 family)